MGLSKPTPNPGDAREPVTSPHEVLASCSRGRGVKIEQALEEGGPGLQL